MSTDDTFIRQAKDQIHHWKHELIELEARDRQGVQSPEESQVNKQRIIELKSQIEETESKIKQQSVS